MESVGGDPDHEKGRKRCNLMDWRKTTQFIEYDKVDKIRGMDICICTTATTDEEAKELLKQLGAPFYA